MIPWFLGELSRLDRERAEIAALADAHWVRGPTWHLNENGRLCVDALLLAGGAEYAVRLTYPTLFPSSPATVAPIGATERWSSHQYGQTGELCLEWGPDNWHPEVTGAMLLESAHRLLRGEAADDVEEQPVPSRHSTSIGQEVRGSIGRFILGGRTREVIEAVPEGRFCEAQFRALFEAGCLLTHAESVSVPGTEEPWKNSEVPEAVLEDGHSVSGYVVATSQKALEPGKIEADVLRGYLEHDALAEALDRESGWRAFLWRHSDGRLSFALQTRPGENARSCEIVALPEERSVTRLPAEFEQIAEKRVAVIGLGSAGSKIAISLARSGVRKLLLVDDDLLLPENLRGCLRSQSSRGRADGASG